jgi:hypothetical protein
MRKLDNMMAPWIRTIKGGSVRSAGSARVADESILLYTPNAGEGLSALKPCNRNSQYNQRSIAILQIRCRRRSMPCPQLLSTPGRYDRRRVMPILFRRPASAFMSELLAILRSCQASWRWNGQPEKAAGISDAFRRMRGQWHLRHAGQVRATADVPARIRELPVETTGAWWPKPPICSELPVEPKCLLSQLLPVQLRS